MAAAKETAKKGANRTFAYEIAEVNSGNRRKGRLTAASKQDALNAIRSAGWVVVSLREVPAGLRGAQSIYDVIPGLSKYKVKSATLSSFSRRLHQLQRAGLTLSSSLRTIAESDETALSEVYGDLAERVSAGSTLAEAMSAYPEVFNETIVSYIDTAERTGTMVETTGRLAQMMERRTSVERRVKSVAAYPVLVSGIIFVVVTGLLLFVVPRFVEVYKSFGAELPRPTQILQALAPYIGVGFLLTGLSIVALFSLRRKRRLPESVDLKFERILWRLPIFGKVTRDLALYRFTSVLAGAIDAGLTIGRSVELAGRSSGSALIGKAAPEIEERIVAGQPLSAALNEYPDIFPSDYRSIVLTGEHSDLSALLASLAVNLDEEIDTNVEGLGAKIEVLLLIVMAVVVGGIIITLYLPVLSLAQTALDGLSG